jgi:hypothetical protein
MWKRKDKVTPGLGADIRIIMPTAALTSIFDECDSFDCDETGGRLIGSYTTHGSKLTINVSGIIEPGPQARRTAVSFFQDGEYQEGIFRRIESQHPEIEHLGNWHTHHVNGLSTLSGGDIDTYNRIVNHHNHNTPFFYALLVTARHKTSDSLRRYSVKHYVFRRGESDFYEIPPQHVEITNGSLVWPISMRHFKNDRPQKTVTPRTHPERVYDRDIIQEFYQGFRPFVSQEIGMYWRGLLEFLDGSKVEVVVLEDSSADVAKYSITLREPPEALHRVADQLAQRNFPSARAALITTERMCNRALYHQAPRSLKHELQHKER